MDQQGLQYACSGQCDLVMTDPACLGSMSWKDCKPCYSRLYGLFALHLSLMPGAFWPGSQCLVNIRARIHRHCSLCTLCDLCTAQLLGTGSNMRCSIRSDHGQSMAPDIVSEDAGCILLYKPLTLKRHRGRARRWCKAAARLDMQRACREKHDGVKCELLPQWHVPRHMYSVNTIRDQSNYSRKPVDPCCKVVTESALLARSRGTGACLDRVIKHCHHLFLSLCLLHIAI